jgi:uncharacterized protein Usg
VCGMSDVNLRRQFVDNYRLTTAEIVYHLPDYPELLQSYIWQEYDIAPRFPELNKFLDFWSHNLDGKLHSIYVASQKLILPRETKIYAQEFTLQ